MYQIYENRQVSSHLLPQSVLSCPLPNSPYWSSKNILSLSQTPGREHGEGILVNTAAKQHAGEQHAGEHLLERLER